MLWTQFEQQLLLYETVVNIFSQEYLEVDVENLNITSDKITKKFESINDVKLDNNKYLE